MTDLCGALASALDNLRTSYRCHPTSDSRTITVTTTRHYTDGDAVEVFVRVSADGLRLAVSDGGMSLSRRDLYGAPELRGTSKSLWDEILDDHGLSEFGGRVYVTGPRDSAEILITQVADAALVLDAVRLLSAGERKTFASKLQSWLQELEGVSVKPESSVTDEFGNEQRMTAIVDSKRGDVLIQGAGGRSLGDVRKNAEHAHWIFSFLRIEDWPVENRLVVLESSLLANDNQKRSTLGVVNRLVTVANVAAFDSRSTVTNFLTLGPGQHRDMVTIGYAQPDLPF